MSSSSSLDTFRDYVESQEIIMSVRDAIIDPNKLVEEIKRVLVETGLGKKTVLTLDEIALVAKQINRDVVLK